MAEVTFNNTNGKTLYFADLAVNESFKVKSTSARGAVYRKVVIKTKNHVESDAQMEEATGKIFPATFSAVERVKVKVMVEADEPKLY